jgi:hypothetical protein
VETISELRSKAAELRQIANKLDEAANALSELGGSTNNNVSVSVAVPGLGDLTGISGVDAIYRVLSEADSPMRKEEISSILSARGKAIGASTLQSYLSRDDRFSSEGRGHWHLTEHLGQALPRRKEKPT